MNLIRKIFGLGPAVNYAELMKNGAQIVDVRSPGEFRSGHVRGSVNIPLPDLANHLSKLKKSKPVITCCASGMRSATAKNILKAHGFTEVYNAGGWTSLQNKLSKAQ